MTEFPLYLKSIHSFVFCTLQFNIKSKKFISVIICKAFEPHLTNKQIILIIIAFILSVLPGNSFWNLFITEILVNKSNLNKNHFFLIDLIICLVCNTIK